MFIIKIDVIDSFSFYTFLKRILRKLSFLNLISCAINIDDISLRFVIKNNKESKHKKWGIILNYLYLDFGAVNPLFL